MLPSPTLWPALPALPWPLQGELQLLCMQLDRHINTHIRESPQAMHQTTLKDLAAQTYIRWQELLAHCQPQVVPPPHSPPGLEGEGSGQLTDQSPQSVCPLCSCQAPGWEMGEGSGGGGDAPLVDRRPSYQGASAQGRQGAVRGTQTS